MYLQIKKAAMALFLSLFCFVAYAQQTVTGTVKDATGEPMIGVTVLADGKPVAVTDLDGNFSIPDCKPSTVVKLSYVGYKDQQVTVGNKSTLNFTMQEDNKALDEVVVVGYGTMKKSDLTGSISSVNSEDIVAKGASNVLSAMQGSVPGVNITQTTGRADGGMNIEIRGKSSIQSSTKPLYIVDGVMTSDIDFLNEQDIEKIDILKDASSTAIYGSRATAGVVMITTKGGLGIKKGSKPSISYDGYYGVAVVSRMPDFQNADEFYKYRFLKFQGYAGATPSPMNSHPLYEMTQAYYNQGMLQAVQGNYSSPSVLKQMLAAGEDYDWPSQVTQNGRQQNHYISVNGSSQDISYNMGLGYNDVEGVYKGDEQSKITFKGGLDANINKWLNAGFDFNMARIKHDYANDEGVQEAFRMNPFMRPFDEDGNIITNPGNKTALGTNGNQFTDSYSPLVIMQNGKRNRTTYRVLGNVYLNFKPFDGLTFKTTFSPNYSNYIDGQWTGDATGDTPQATRTTYRSFGWTWDNVLTYNKIFNKIHRLNVMGLYSMEGGNSESGTNTFNNPWAGTYWYNLGKVGLTKEDGSLNVIKADNSYSESEMVSYAFRLNYTLLDRYMFTGTVRWDGSSKFRRGHRWGSFPSLALAWRMSEEKFIKDNLKWVSNLKLRLSYGVTGNNTGISNYEWYQGIVSGYYYPFGASYVNGSYPDGIKDADITWEKSNEWNLGLDFGFLRNRIFGSVDVYRKTSKDLLFGVTLPLEVGGIQMTTNIGSVRNTGVEASVTGVIIQNKDWNWTVTANYSHNSNHIKEIDGTGNDFVSSKLFLGRGFNVQYGYQYGGVVSDREMTVPDNQAAVSHGFTPGSKVLERDYYYNVYGWTEGNPIVKDINGDGSINENDKRVMRGDPAWIGNLSTTLSYKGWDFSATLYTKQHYWISSAFLNRYCDMGDRGRGRLNMDYYIPAGTLIDCDGVNADGTYINPKYQQTTHYGNYPFPNNGGSNGGTNNSYYTDAIRYQDISFTKIKNITLGYTFPKNWTSKFGCSTLRLYMTVTNPFVITGFKGFDPEWADASLKNDGPSTTTWQFGANIKF